MKNNWKIYILLSLNHNKTYTGCSHDVEERLAQHNTGRVRSTARCAPWVKIYEENVGDYAAARKRERYFKTAAGRRRLVTIMREWRDARVVEGVRLESV